VPYRLGNFDEQPFATPSRKIELSSETMRAAGLDLLPDYVPPARERAADDIRSRYPLILLTGDREKSYHHSRFRGEPWAAKVSPDPTLLIHPDTAQTLGIGAGDWVTVETPAQLPPCRLRAKLSDATARDVVSTGMGWWRPDAPAPQHGALDININAAMTYAGPFDPASGSPDARGLLCRVARAAEQPA
jgi:thiosulfate reductase/polysulfide reductase chain A